MNPVLESLLFRTLNKSKCPGVSFPYTSWNVKCSLFFCFKDKQKAIKLQILCPQGMLRE